MINQDRFRYPIGQFEYGKTYSIHETRKHMAILANFPKQLKKVLKKLRRDEYDVPYRMGGWTVRQVVHHMADSHMNAFIRMKLAIVDNGTSIKPYPEAIWAELPDGKQAPIRMSVRLLSALHRRWHYFMEKLTETDLEQGYFHPASNRTVSMPEALALYAWHAEHHLAHIKLVVSGENYTEQGVAVPQQPDMRPLQQAGHRRFTVTLVDKEIPKQSTQPKPLEVTPTDGVEKKKAGRPKAVATAGADGVEKKSPGRPKAAAVAGADGVEKKRPGRPKAAATAGADGVEKKSPGRPKAAAAAGADGVEKKRAGRPKAAVVAGADGVEKKRAGRPKAASVAGSDGVEKKRAGRPKKQIDVAQERPVAPTVNEAEPIVSNPDERGFE
jgi:hypothetical protein